MNSFCGILLMTILAMETTVAQIYTIDLVGPLSASAFSCIYRNEYTYTIVRAYSLEKGGSVDPNIVQTLQNARKAYITTSIYMVICRNNNSIFQINTVIDSIPQNLYRFLFIKVIPNNVTGCQWPAESNSHTDNCRFLTKAIKQIKKKGLHPGIYSTAKIWKSLFGNSCDTLADLGTYLWYANQNQNGEVDATPNIDDFEPFGGWTYPILKQVSGSTEAELCGNPNWRVLIKGVLVV